MIENPHRALIATLNQNTQHRELVFSLPKSQNLRLSTGIHPIEIHAVQKGQHLLQVLSPAPDPGMPVVPVIHDPHMPVTRGTKSPANRDKIGGLTAPPSMIIEPQLTAHFSRVLGQRKQHFCGRGDVLVMGRLPGAGKSIPDLRMKIILPEEPKSLIVLTPEGEVFNAMFLILQDFLLELSNMFASPVIGTPTKA
tara:strand:- start:86 stop:670 length:585 start_codon:yes stop_codon:yes gene_type:complete